MLPWSLKSRSYLDKKRWWQGGGSSGKAWQRQRRGKAWANHLTSHRPLALPLSSSSPYPILTGGQRGVRAPSSTYPAARRNRVPAIINPPACIDPRSADSRDHLSVFSPLFFFITESYDDPTQQLVQVQSLKENYFCGTKREHVLLFARNSHC